METRTLVQVPSHMASPTQRAWGGSPRDNPRACSSSLHPRCSARARAMSTGPVTEDEHHTRTQRELSAVGLGRLG